MIRGVIVTILFLYGLVQAFRTPFHALLFYLWVAHFRPQEWAWGGLVNAIPVSTIAAALMLGYLLLHVVLGRVRLTLGPLQVFMLLFLGQAWISTSFSVAPDFSARCLDQFAKVVLVSYCITVLVDDLPKLRLALIVISASLGFETARQGLVELVAHPGSQNLNVIHQLGDNNYVALGMAILACITVALFMTTRVRWQRAAYGLLTVGILLRGITTYSRGGLLALAVLGAMVWWREKRKIRHALLALVAVLVVASVMPERYFQRMETMLEVTSGESTWEKSAASRPHLWAVAVDMANDRPWHGVGFWAYQLAYDDYDDSQGEFGRGLAAHGTFPGVLADNGYPGLILYAIVVVLALRYAARARKVAETILDNRELAAYARAVHYALIAFLVGGTFISFMYIELIWHLYGVSAALAAITEKMVRERAAAVTGHAAPGVGARVAAAAARVGRTPQPASRRGRFTGET